jgi:hypothetical protein
VIGIDWRGRTADGSDCLLEHELAGSAAIDAVEQHGGPDRRVAGKGKLGGGREDAQSRPVAWFLGRQHEHGLSEVELASDRLHDRPVEPFSIEHDGEGVAGEAPAGEHVEGDKSSAHCQLLPGWAASLRAAASAASASPSSAIGTDRYTEIGEGATYQSNWVDIAVWDNAASW